MNPETIAQDIHLELTIGSVRRILCGEPIQTKEEYDLIVQVRDRLMDAGVRWREQVLAERRRGNLKQAASRTPTGETFTVLPDTATEPETG